MSRRSIGLCAAAGVCFAVDLITFHYAVDVIGAGLATVMGNLQVVDRGAGGLGACSASGRGTRSWPPCR